MCSCHSILECCVMFSGVKLSIRSFVLSYSLIKLSRNSKCAPLGTFGHFYQMVAMETATVMKT